MSSMYFMCALPRSIERRSPKSTACQGKSLLGNVCTLTKESLRKLLQLERVRLHKLRKHPQFLTVSLGPAIRPSAAEAVYFCFSNCFRILASDSRISGVRASPKSSASKIGRIPNSAPSPNGLRFSHSTVSSTDFTRQIQKPAINSLVSANGPSVTVSLPPGNFTRLPFELGCSPSP